MKLSLNGSAVTVIASILSFLLVIGQVSTTALQQIILLSIIVILISLNKVYLNEPKKIDLKVRLLLLGVVTFALQVLILSSGSLYSPFLILFYLFAVGVGLLISFTAFLTFLICTIFLLISSLFFNQTLKMLALEDPGSLVLYITSFLAIIPLIHLLISHYHLNEALARLLARQMRLNQLREQSILENLSDLVIITGINLHILSFNEPAQRILRLSYSELINRFLFEVLFLKDSGGNTVNENYLNINKLLEEKKVLNIDNLTLHIKNTILPEKVNLKIYPTVNLEGKIDQIAFILTRKIGQEISQAHKNLEQARIRHEAVFEDLKEDLLSKGLIDLNKKASLLGKAEHDILTSMELEDHIIHPVTGTEDIASLLSHIVSIEKLFAKMLKVDLIFSLDNRYIKEAKEHIPSDSRVSPSELTSLYFTAVVDNRWFDILMQKLLELSILLTSATKNPKVNLYITYDKEYVFIKITTFSKTAINDKKLLFKEYYGNLGKYTNLTLGSGLEGAVARVLANLLNITIDTTLQNNIVEFTLKLSKGSYTI